MKTFIDLHQMRIHDDGSCVMESVFAKSPAGWRRIPMFALLFFGWIGFFGSLKVVDINRTTMAVREECWPDNVTPAWVSFETKEESNEPPTVPGELS